LAYIGNIPADKYTSFAKQDFTVTATTSYTLDHSVSNENEIALFINFVRQEPTTSYSCIGNQLTLTEATSVGDDMYCVFIGKAVQTVNPPSGSVNTSQLVDGAITTAKLGDASVTSAKLSGVTQGVKNAAIFRNTTTLTNPSGDIAFTMEQLDDTASGNIGTVPVSYSSPVFTFSVSGVYLILVQITTSQASSDNANQVEMRVSIDGGTNYYLDSLIQTRPTGGGASTFMQNMINTTTTASNCKIKFTASSFAGGSQIIGNTDYSWTSISFIRIGDAS